MWNDVADPSDSWSNVSDPGDRHTYGEDVATGSRIRLGDNVKYGGSGEAWSDESDPSDTWSDV